MQGMHFFFCLFFLCKRDEPSPAQIQAHCLYACLLACLLACFKMKCMDKNNQIKSTTLSLSSYPNSLPLKRANAELRAAAAELYIFYPHPHLQEGASFTWCTFLLPSSGLCLLLPLGGGGGGCCFLGVVFGRALCGGGSGRWSSGVGRF